MSKRVLMVGTYPIVSPQHGGQKRAKAIFDAYSAAPDIEAVKYVSVIVGTHYLMHSRDDIAVSRATLQKVEEHPNLSDLLCGKAIYEDKKVKDAFLALLHKFKPTVIQIEQTYPYMGLRLLLEEIGYDGILVNSTHNVELNMKQEMYDSMGVDMSTRGDALKEIGKTEKDLAERAALNIAVSQEDAAYMRKHYGAKDVLIVPNGMESPSAKSFFKERWQRHFRAQRVDYIVLFVGSSHQPNMTGFMKMVSKKVGFLPKHARIVVVGGVSDLIKNSLRNEVVEDVCLPLRVELLGRRSEEDLHALLSLADTIILPITEGGGSNLKTAEALLSGKRIVATEHAFRGYDTYRDLTGVEIANAAEAFQKSIVHNIALRDEPLPARPEVAGVLWENVLSPLVEKVGRV